MNVSADPAEQAAAAVIAHWRSDRDFAELARFEGDVLLEALRIVGEYDAEILAGITATVLEAQARRAPVVPLRRRDVRA